MAATAVSDRLERDLWLIPIEDRRKQKALREGMRGGFTLGQYLMLVDYTSRLVRDGKAAVTAEVESIFTRLGSSAESWGARMLKLKWFSVAGSIYVGQPRSVKGDSSADRRQASCSSA